MFVTLSKVCVVTALLYIKDQESTTYRSTTSSMQIAEGQL